MTTLSIEIPRLDGDQDESVDQRIKVTHLHARMLSTTELLMPQPSRPGIVVLLPQSDRFTLVINHKPRLLVPGLALILDGHAEWSLRPSPSREPDENSGEMTGIIELNALINGAIPLQERLKASLIHLDPIPSEDVARLFNTFANNRESFVLTPGSPDVIHHLAAAQLVAMLLKTTGDDQLPAGEASMDDPKLIKLKTFLMKHLASSLSIDDMARHMGLSRSAFYRWSKPLFEGSPVQYLRKLRLEKSQELLRGSTLSIEQIATLTGFNSRYHLGTEFVKHYHITPAQLRRSTRSESKSDLIGHVANLIREKRFQQALGTCRKNLKNPALKTSRNHIHDQMAWCYYALGRIGEAVEIWERLRKSSWAYTAGKQLCSHYYRYGKHDRVAAILADLYPQARERQQQELIMIWCHHVAGLIDRQQAGPIHLYLEIRRKFFPADLRSMSVTADALIGLGQEHRVVEECPELHDMHVFTLRRAGLHRRALEENEALDHQDVIKTLIFAGEYEQVLAQGADYPDLMASALTRLGCPEEAIRRYHDQCKEAYLVLGRYRNLLDRWPEPSECQVMALAGLNDRQALRQYPKTIPWVWALAQFMLGPDHFLRVIPAGKTQLHQRAHLWKAIQCLMAGKNDEANRCLNRIPRVLSDHFWCWPDIGCHEVMLTAATRGLTDSMDLAVAELKKIVADYKYTDWQVMWHDAAFLTGTIDPEIYRKQPCQARLSERLAIIQALDRDLHGYASCRNYQSLLKQLDGFYLLDKPHLREFIAWRILALA